MEYLPDMDTLTQWLVQYGSFAIFGLLALGIIALPVPEETLMVIAGILMAQDILEITPTVVAATGGSIFGITISYILGRTLGLFFIHKYGRWVGITEERLKKVHNWFEIYGKWTLLIGYFIPGVRHLTGFCAGASYLEYNLFALYAYTGAVFWVACFLSVGYFFGNYWLTFIENHEFHIDEVAFILIILALIIVAAYFVIKNLLNKRSS